MTQRKLAEYAGTEIVTMEFALALGARGHEVAVYCPRPGKLVDVLASNGIASVASIADVPWRPDLIHAHHRLPALAALARFADVPCVYMCHGLRPWVESPPLHPQITLYVAVSQKLATHIATRFGIAPDRVRVVNNCVDTKRFSRVRPPIDGPPTRAVLFGQSSFTRREIDALDEACGQRGIALDTIGYAYGNPRLNPELFLPDYDIAFAIGRSAIEAMACGCATIPVVPSLAGALVEPDTFDGWADVNFSPRYFTTADQIGPAWLDAQLARLDPRSVAAVTARVRSEFSIEACVDALEAIYREASATAIEGECENALVAEFDRLAREVDELWEAGEVGRREPSSVKLPLHELRALLTRGTQQSDDLKEVARTLHGLIVGLDRAEIPDDAIWVDAVRRSGLFHPQWYLEQNPDVAAAGMDPLHHYLVFGAAEGREPSAYFDSKAFLEANPELAELSRNSGISPLELLLREASRRGNSGEDDSQTMT